jgi:hypothetical protein
MGIVWACALCSACWGEIAKIPPPPPSTADGGSSDAPFAYEDASVTLDATGDAQTQPPIDADWVGPWCSTNFPYGVTLCDDFDLLGTPKPEWATTGSLVVVDTPFMSAPHALHVVAAPGATSTLRYSPQPTAIETKVGTQVLIAADGDSSSSGDPVVFAIECGGGQSLGVAIVPGTSNARFVIAGFSSTKPLSDFSFARGVWHEIELKLSVNGDGTYNPLCMVDGVDQSASTGSVSKPVGNMTTVVGFTATTTKPIDAYYDNVWNDVMQ